MKNRNTIVDAWSYKIPGLNAAKDGCGIRLPISDGKERRIILDRFVEWGSL